MFDPFTLRQMIAEHGSVGTIVYKTEKVYDAASGQVDESVLTEHAKMYVFNNDKTLLNMDSLVDTNTFVYGHARILISDKLIDGRDTPQIATGDTIVVNGRKVFVVRAGSIVSAGKPMCIMVYAKGPQ